MLEPPPLDKLEMLRQLDRYRPWTSIDDRRRCLQCGRIITGREIRLLGAAEKLTARCPTPGCAAIPLDWALVTPQSIFDGARE